MRLRKTATEPYIEGKIHLIGIEWYQQLIFFFLTLQFYVQQIDLDDQWKRILF